MRILLLGCKDYPPFSHAKDVGGLEVFLYEILREWKHDVFLFTRRYPKAKEREDYGNVHVFRVPFIDNFFLKTVSFNFLALFKAAKVCRDENIQIIWAHDPAAGAVAFFISKMTGVPYVYEVQSRGSLEPGSLLRRWGLRLLEFFAFASPSSVVFVGENIRREISQRRGLKNTVVIPMAINARKFKRAGKPVEEIAGLKKRGKKIVCFVGRLHPVKGVDVLIRALAESKRNDVVLLVVGDGPARAGLEKLVRELRVESVFLGARRDVEKIMPWCDLFVLPSYSEGTSPVLLEAMASAVPVIASSVGEAPRLLSEEFLFEAGNAGQLLEKIDWALKVKKVPKFPGRYDARVVARELERELERHVLK